MGPGDASQTISTLSLEQSQLHIHICTCLILCESCSWVTMGPQDVSLLNITLASPPQRLLSEEPALSGNTGYLHHSSTIELSSPLIVIIWQYSSLGASLSRR